MQAEERGRGSSSHDFPLMYPSRGRDLREETNRQAGSTSPNLLSSGLCSNTSLTHRSSGTKRILPMAQRLSAKSLGRQDCADRLPLSSAQTSFPLPPRHSLLSSFQNGIMAERGERERTFFEAKGGTAASQRLPACSAAPSMH